MSTLVSVVHGDDVVTLLDQALCLLGGIEKFVSPGDVVLIKPNSFSKQVPANGNVAKPELVIALAKLVRDAGARRVVVGERNKAAFVANFENSGVEKVAEFLPFEDAETVSVTVPNAKALQTTVTVPKILLDCDKHITVPVGKTHCGAGVTACIKNAMGLMVGSETIKSHAYGICNVPLDINSLKWPVLGVVDMMVSQEGNFPGPSATPVPMGVVVASGDIIAADATCARLMGYDPRDVWMIRSGALRGLGKMAEEDITVVGEDIARVGKKLTGVIFDPTEFGDRVNFCVDLRCRFCAQDVTSFLRSDAGKELMDKLGRFNIVVGPVPEAKIDESLPTLVIGNCNAWLMDLGPFVHGCPPAVWQIAQQGNRLL